MEGNWCRLNHHQSKLLLLLGLKGIFENCLNRYRSIRSDLQPLIEKLQAGELPGDRIAGVKYQVFKVRLKNSNIQKGKSGGYWVIYYVKTEQGIILTTIYSKSDVTDVSNEIIEDAIAQYEQEIQAADNSN